MEGLTRQQELNQLRNAKQIVKELSAKLGVTEEEEPVGERNPLAADTGPLAQHPVNHGADFSRHRDQPRPPDFVGAGWPLDRVLFELEVLEPELTDGRDSPSSVVGEVEQF